MEVPRVREKYQQTLELCRANNDKIGEARVLFQLGVLELEEGNLVESRCRFEESGNVFNGLGHPSSDQINAEISYRLGTIDLWEGKYSEARPRFEQWLIRMRAAQNLSSEASVVGILGKIDYAEKRYGSARVRVSEALSIQTHLRNDIERVRLLSTLSSIDVAEGHDGDAAKSLAAGVKIARDIRSPLVEMEIFEEVALFAWKRGHRRIAILLLGICKSFEGDVGSANRDRIAKGFSQMAQTLQLSESSVEDVILQSRQEYRNDRAARLVEQALQ